MKNCRPQERIWQRMQLADTSTIVNQLFADYRVEGLTMPYTIEDFRREVAREHVHELTPAERLAGLPAKDVVQRYAPEQLLAAIWSPVAP